MKRLGFVLVIAFLVIGTISAQNWVNPQSVTVNGTLQLQNGQIAVVSGNTAFFCPMIGRYVGFIEGLKEGSSVTIEGFANGNILHPTKLTVSGKSYDFLANNNGGYYCNYSERFCNMPMAGCPVAGRGGMGRRGWR